MPRERRFGLFRRRARGDDASFEPIVEDREKGTTEEAEEPEGPPAEAAEPEQLELGAAEQAESAPEVEPESDPEPESEQEPEVEPEPEPESDPEPESEQERPDTYSGLATLSLGDINENRRESVARRLSALRERGPHRPVPPLEPQVEPPQAEPAEQDVPPAEPTPNALSAAGHSIAERWGAVPKIVRQRIAAAVIVAAVVLIVLLVILPAAPCEAPGGDACPSDDDAIALVPDDALAYVHADVDPDTDQYAEVAAIASRIPLLTRFALSGASRELSRVDFTTQIRPWAGDELALALLPGGRRPERVLMVEVDDAAGARSFADELLGPGVTTADVGGTEVSRTKDGTASAIADGFLLIGGDGAVTEIADPAGERGTLADSAAATETLADLPEDRLAYAYMSGAGARALLADRSLSSLDTFVDAGATTGVGVALSASEGVLQLEALSTLDPTRAEATPGFFGALPPFEPALPDDVGSDALAYLGLGDPATSVDALLDQAAADNPDLLAAFDSVDKSLRKESGISLREDLLPLLGTEAALSVEPVGSESASTAPGTLAPSGVPYVSLIADGIDGAAASSSLANLQKPLVDALGSGGSAPVSGFETAKIAGVDAQSLLVNSDINLTYAVSDDRLVIATNPIGIEQARVESDGLSGSEGFEQVTADLPEAISLLAYLDLRGLLSLGEQIGLAEDPTYAAVAPDLRALGAAALAVTDDEQTIRTDLRIAVGDPAGSEVEPPPLGGE